MNKMNANTTNNNTYPTNVPVVDVGEIVGVAPVVNPLISGEAMISAMAKTINATAIPAAHAVILSGFDILDQCYGFRYGTI
jgi:hypothetical protein